MRALLPMGQELPGGARPIAVGHADSAVECTHPPQPPFTFSPAATGERGIGTYGLRAEKAGIRIHFTPS